MIAPPRTSPNRLLCHGALPPNRLFDDGSKRLPAYNSERYNASTRCQRRTSKGLDDGAAPFATATVASIGELRVDDAEGDIRQPARRRLPRQARVTGARAVEDLVRAGEIKEPGFGLAL